MKNLHLLLLFICLPISLYRFRRSKVFSGTYVDANDPNIPADFAYQGEYAGSGMGAQVIALDNGGLSKSFFSRRVAGSWMGR